MITEISHCHSFVPQLARSLYFYHCALIINYLISPSTFTTSYINPSLSTVAEEVFERLDAL